MHWIYNYEKLDEILGNRVEIEFTEPSVNPFYTIHTGKQTCYGGQAFALLESLVECKGLVNYQSEYNYHIPPPPVVAPGAQTNRDGVVKF